MTIKKQLKRTKNKVIRKLQKQYSYKNAVRQFDNKLISPYGGYIDIMNFANLLGLDKNLKDHFIISKASHRRYTDVNLFQRLLDTVILDINRIDNANLFYNDPLLRYIENLNTDPSPSTLRRELKSCNNTTLQALDSINAQFLNSCSSLAKKKNVTLIIDLTPINSYGNQEEVKKGYNHHETDVCYQAMLSTIKETDDVIKIELKPGNFTPNADTFSELFKKTMSMIPNHLNVNKIRLDSGFFGFATINLLDEYKLTYFIKGKMQPNTQILNTAASIPEKNWIKMPNRDNFWVSKKIDYYSPMYKKSYPVIFTRTIIEDTDPKQKKLFNSPVYQYASIFSNSHISEINIVNSYNDGAAIETIIKELKNEYFITNIPTSKFIANNAFIKIKALAHNLLNAFKRFVLGGKWINKSAKAIRNWIIKAPVIVTHFGKGIKLHMPQNSKLQQFILSISDKVYGIGVNLIT